MREGGKSQKQDGESCGLSRQDFVQRIYSPHSIAAIVSELNAQGIDASETLDGTGLDRPQLEAHTTQISYRQLDTVIRNALRLSKDSAIALRAGQRMHVTTYGMYGYALLSSPTYADARDFANRYIRVIGPFCDARNVYDETTVLCTVEPRHWVDPTEDAYRFAVEFALAAHLMIARDVVGPSFDTRTSPSSMRRRNMPPSTTNCSHVRFCSRSEATPMAMIWRQPMVRCRSPTRAVTPWRARCASKSWPRSIAEAASRRTFGGC